MKSSMTRRQLFERMRRGRRDVAGGAAVGRLFGDGFAVSAQALPLTAIAGVDRVVMKHGKTYLNGWAGYGEPPRRGRDGRRGAAPPAPPPPIRGPRRQRTWSKVSGPGDRHLRRSEGRGHDRDVLGARRLRAPGDGRQRRRRRPRRRSTVQVELPPPANAADAGRTPSVTRSQPALDRADARR